MNRIDAKFAALKEQELTAFIPFLTIGDPDVRTSIDIIHELEKAGASMVELGVPYSDPLADGPVIQRSSMRALKANRITILDVIGAAKTAREEGSELPFILFTYYNPVLQTGLDRIFPLLMESSISGLIIPDLPMEEDEEVRRLAEQHGIHLIPLVAPTSRERVERIASRASGFVYCVSSLGVTGTRTEFHTGIDEFLSTVKGATSLPIAIGFGISTPEQVARFSGVCDGIVVGSALVRTVEEALPLLSEPASRREGLLQIHDFVRTLVGNGSGIVRT
ncbi:tryptophan synthase subunit alpha [Paenibacillus mucilaginosus]|uniref:Tryptophan synthase alpha chain n=1 Tax=Paenibacillus mucilaginosus (strain KNP414) TaxID=1036673 RepID=F8FAV6_PAEMK|nr:tryptophan synthase subunit alpha [Paenibacillus mucilaginosus]AEI41357.1 tryptophan synthase, alpha subunit [Paenibacillus mucilaginosus KNP414]MCG7211223.1 tryptophan synthase subunit alpha [Paenibacillus mucilaginosus]WDM30383.1 tryptophan synthase subunit alpha [Paenibacillus mucilaginosus]